MFHVYCNANLLYSIFVLPTTIPIQFYITSHGMKVMTHIKLFILSEHLMPWLETIGMLLLNNGNVRLH